MTQYSGDEFIGFSVSREEKQAVRSLAAQRGLTMSDLLRKMLAEELQDSGVKPESPGPPSEPLPFEENVFVVSDKEPGRFRETAINRELKKA